MASAGTKRGNATPACTAHQPPIASSRCDPDRLAANRPNATVQSMSLVVPGHRVVRTHSVPSACPSVRLLTASHSLTRCPRLARSSCRTQWIRDIKLVPKLTVRVRFPSPAQHAKSVAGTATSTVSLKPVNAHSRPKTALVQLRVPLAILASAPGDCQFLS